MLSSVSNAYTEGEQQKIQAFLTQVFPDKIPLAKRLWLSAEYKTQLQQRLGQAPNKLSYRYWQDEDTVVWLLDEIGKERNITTAVVMKNNQVADVKVVIYRESKGGEVQIPWFTAQFQGVTSLDNWQKDIDSISGATLSVNALKKQVTMALALNALIP
ncbi:MAG: FMN-binding protein [Proteobacteria bacterium]|nr:FMN-binding protein [Pseudomonadota bacterium]